MANIGSGPGWILQTGAEKIKTALQILDSNLREGKIVDTK